MPGFFHNRSASDTEHLTRYRDAAIVGCSAAERTPMAANFDAPSPALAPRGDVRELPPGVLLATMPQAILEAGERAAFHSVEFFTARISNPHTRAAYGRAVAGF